MAVYTNTGISQILLESKKELGILFLHHRNDKLTKYHFDLLKQNNEDAIIFPIQDETKEGLPGAIKLDKNNIYWDIDTDRGYSEDAYIYETAAAVS